MKGLWKISQITRNFSRGKESLHTANLLRSLSLGARKKKSTDEDITKIMNNLPEGWTKVTLGEKEEVEDAVMDRRIDDAKKWVSLALSDEEVAFFNKKLGIDEKALLAMQEEEEKAAAKKSKKRLSQPPLAASPYESNDPSEIQTRNLRGYLQINPFLCSGCGTAFQTKTEDAPGYLPADKFAEHRSRAQQIKEKQEAIKILETAEVSLDSPAAEEFLRLAKVSPSIIEGIKKIGEQLRSLSPASSTPPSKPSIASSDPQEIDSATDLPSSGPGESGEGLEEKICVCQRCFRLQQYGQVREALRPGWSNLPLLSPEHFTSLLQNIKSTKTVVLSIVDIFDLQTSILPTLHSIVGANPLIVAVNKVDLLPTDISERRVRDYVVKEVRKIGGWEKEEEEDRGDKKWKKAEGGEDGWESAIDDPRDNRRSSPRSSREYGKGYYSRLRKEKLSYEEGDVLREDVKLVSCQTGYGIDALLKRLLEVSKEHGCNTIHVLGAANSGKSSFINRLLAPPRSSKSSSSAAATPLVTVSPLPGTTLDFLRIKLPNPPLTLIDTPGILPPGHLTCKLTPAELAQILPRKSVKPVTLRVLEGKAVLIGGLAKIELTQGRPVFFTVFASPEIKIHYTDSLKAEEFVAKHLGSSLLSPPESPQRLAQLGPMESASFDLSGTGWKASDYDVVIPGIGWVAITGPGDITVRVTAPKDTKVSVRPALLPYEAKYSTATYTGTRVLQRSAKTDKQTGRWKQAGASQQRKV
eukprot:gene26471-31993_t